jgi:hypothetical protein
MVKKKRRPKFNKRKKTLREKIKPLAISFAVLSIIGLIVWGVLRVMESPFLKAKITWEIDTKLPITQAVLKESVHALTNNKYQFDTDKIKTDSQWLYFFSEHFFAFVEFRSAFFLNH